MIDKDLAARLKSYRNFKHLTQKDVAAYLKVPHSAISDIENGKRDITVSELRIFSNLYGRSVEEIMSGKKYDYYNSILKIIRLHVYRQVAKVVVLTKSDKSRYDENLSKEQTIIISNPVIVPEYFHSKLDNKQAIAMGRIQYQKGFDTLTDVFEIVHKKHPDWIVNIYGDGNYKDKIEKYIKQKGLEDVVVLKGRTTDVFSVMRNSSFFILSSRFEGFGMVIAEAMTQGLPAISFDCPTGPSDIIQTNVNGILVENQNIQAMADAICYMIENPNERKRMGKNAVEIVKQFSGDIIVNKWLDLFNSLEK